MTLIISYITSIVKMAIFSKGGEDQDQDHWMDFSNNVLGKSIVAVIYSTYWTSVGALDYVTRVDNFSRQSTYQQVDGRDNHANGREKSG